MYIKSVGPELLRAERHTAMDNCCRDQDNSIDANPVWPRSRAATRWANPAGRCTHLR